MGDQFVISGEKTVREQDAYTDESAALAEACRWAADGIENVIVRTPDGLTWLIDASVDA